jgi:predicted ArsR family transcriptional regulator
MQHSKPDAMDDAMSRTRTNERYRRIVAILRQRGYVTNEKLAKTFGVTVQTVRRDVRKLADDGEVCRHHGGVGLASSIIWFADRARPERHHAMAQAHWDLRHTPRSGGRLGIGHGPP